MYDDDRVFYRLRGCLALNRPYYKLKAHHDAT